MALPVRETASPLGRIHDEIDRVFQDFTTSRFWPWAEGAGRVPSLDLYEKNGNLVLDVELPGIDKKDVKVSYTDITVTIQGESKQEKEEKKEGYYRSERQYGSFYRSIPLPQPVDFAQAKAEFKDGVLTITLPKTATPEAAVRTIPISE
jgi:HSP20 family protein